MGTTFDSIARGLNEAVVHAKGKKVTVEIYQPGGRGCFGIASKPGYDARAICREVWVFCCNLAPLGTRRSFTAWCVAGVVECH